MKLMNEVVNRESSYSYVIPTQNVLFSKETQRVALKKGIIDKNGLLIGATNIEELDGERKKLYQDLLAYDPAYMVAEYLQDHLSFYHPEAAFDLDTLTIENMEYSGTFIEDLLNLLIEEFSTAPEKLFEDLFYRPTYFMKDLAFGDQSYIPVLFDEWLEGRRQRLMIEQIKASSLPDKEEQIERIKAFTTGNQELNTRLKKEALDSEHLENLYKTGIQCAERFKALKPYEQVMEERYMGLHTQVTKTFVINASEKEFEQLLKDLRKDIKRLSQKEKNLIKDKEIKLSKNNQISTALTITTQKRKPEFSKIAETDLYKLDGRLYFMKDGEGLSMTYREFIILTVIGHLYPGYAKRIFYSDIVKAMGIKNHDLKIVYEEIDGIISKYIGVLGTFEYRMTYKDTGKAIEYNPENRNFLSELKESGYEFTDAKIEIARERNPVLKIADLRNYKNSNGKLSASFILEGQPQIESIATAFNQFIKVNPGSLGVGLSIKDDLGWGIVYSLLKDLSWSSKEHWTYDYSKLLSDLGADSSEFQDKKKKHRNFKKLEKILNHFQSIGLITKFRSNHETNLFVIYPEQMSLEGIVDKTEIKRIKRINDKRSSESIDREFYQKLANSLKKRPFNLYYYPELQEKERLPIIQKLTKVKQNPGSSFVIHGVLDVDELKKRGIKLNP